MQGAQVRSLVRELDPTCMPQLRVHMPQLRSPPAATKTQRNQIKNNNNNNMGRKLPFRNYPLDALHSSGQLMCLVLKTVV